MNKDFDILAFLMGKQAGGGGGDITVESKSISSNGAYTAPTVNVPNTYAAGDEGKVVSNGALVAQGSDTVTQNGTVDTTLLSSLVVDVPTGGYGYTKLAEKDYTVNTSSTTTTILGAIDVGSAAWTAAKMIYVRVRDKAGKRNGYFFGSDTFFINSRAANAASNDLTNMPSICIRYVSSTWSAANSLYGVYSDKIIYGGSIQISAKYGSSAIIDGTYHVEVYALDWPDGVSPFAT